MLYYGICANEHDASVAVIRDEEILFASTAERYSRQKNDPHLNRALLEDAMQYGAPDLIIWYEKPHLKRWRRLLSGQYRECIRVDGSQYLKRFGLRAPIEYVGHHESHAAAGYFTSPFSSALVLVFDAIGEWDTFSAWDCQGTTMRCIGHDSYPHSLGLLYSAFTQRIGLKPNEEEFILMGMAGYGEPRYIDLIYSDLVERWEPPHLVLRENVHRGIRWWHPEITNRMDIAASIQSFTEQIILETAAWYASVTGHRNLVLMGGVALNCLANTRIARASLFDRLWIAPNPGDAGSSLGAVAAYQKSFLHWRTPYLGHCIARDPDCDAAVAALLASQVIGLAHGRSEFGPRALGNRSLLADPRGVQTKDRMNQYKRREPFRPFAPVVLAEFAHIHFDMPVQSSPYMQFVARVMRPTEFPAITHVDGTARVQTLSQEDNPILHRILSEFYRETGCPMLLNTSLNVKGEPLVNDLRDVEQFQASTGISVF